MDKPGDKEYRGYTWEVTEEVKDAESRYSVNVFRVEKPGEYHYALFHFIPKNKLEELGIPRDPKSGAPSEGWIKWQIDKYISGSDGFGIDEYNFGINKQNRLDSINRLDSNKKELATRRCKFISILILLTVIQFFVVDIGPHKFHMDTHTILIINGGIFLMEITLAYIHIHNSKVL